jgi:hypothetical protein
LGILLLSAIATTGACASFIVGSRFKRGIGFIILLRTRGGIPLEVPASRELRVARFLGAPGGLIELDATLDLATKLVFFSTTASLMGAVVFF